MRTDHTDAPAGSEYAAIYLAFELSKAKWQLGIMMPGAEKMSRYRIAALHPGYGSASGLSSLRLPPGRKIGQRLRIGGGIEAEDAAALVHFLGDEILERSHLEGF